MAESLKIASISTTLDFCSNSGRFRRRPPNQRAASIPFGQRENSKTLTTPGGDQMAINVLELHHHAVRVPPAKALEVARFYQDVLGLHADPKRPDIPSVPGGWMYVGADGGPTTQIHDMGADGMPPCAK